MSHPDNGKEITIYCLSDRPDRVGAFLFGTFEDALKFRDTEDRKKWYPNDVHILQVDAVVKDCFDPHEEDE